MTREKIDAIAWDLFQGMGTIALDLGEAVQRQAARDILNAALESARYAIESAAELTRLRAELAEALAKAERQWEGWIKADCALKETRADLEKAKQALRHIYEEWAGSEGHKPETCAEGYWQFIIKRMADTAARAISQLENSK